MEMLLEPSQAANEWPVEEENGRKAATFAWPRTRMPVLVKKKGRGGGVRLFPLAVVGEPRMGVRPVFGLRSQHVAAFELQIPDSRHRGLRR